MSNSQVNKLKSEIQIGIEVILNLSSNVVGSSNDKTNFPDKLLLINTQVSRICKAFAIGSSANIKFSKTQLSKIVQLGRFLGRLIGPLLRTGLPLIGNVLKSLAKSILVPLGLTAAAAATDAVIEKKFFESGTATLVFSNEVLNASMKIIKSLEEPDLLTKGVGETVEMKQKKEKENF